MISKYKETKEKYCAMYKLHHTLFCILLIDTEKFLAYRAVSRSLSATPRDTFAWYNKMLVTLLTLCESLAVGDKQAVLEPFKDKVHSFRSGVETHKYQCYMGVSITLPLSDINQDHLAAK